MPDAPSTRTDCVQCGGRRDGTGWCPTCREVTPNAVPQRRSSDDRPGFDEAVEAVAAYFRATGWASDEENPENTLYNDAGRTVDAAYPIIERAVKQWCDENWT